MDEKKTYKFMADIFASGLWDRGMGITLEMVLGHEDPELEKEIEAWQDEYDLQFREKTWEFDWDSFNMKGEYLCQKIQERAPSNVTIFYQMADDRRFFDKDGN